MTIVELVELAVRQGGLTFDLARQEPVSWNGLPEHCVVGQGGQTLVETAGLEVCLKSLAAAQSGCIRSNTFGLWRRPDGLWELEPVELLNGRQVACLMARRLNQFSVWDLGQGREVLALDVREFTSQQERDELWQEWRNRQ